MELFDLAKLEGMTAKDIYFTQGVEPILAAIKQEIDDFEPDTTTDKGRKAIASLSGKVSSCKARMEKAADSLTEEARKQTKKVNLVKKQVSEECATLRDLARKPLTDYEAAQELIKAEERKQAELVLAEAEAYHMHGLYSQQKEQERIAELQRKQQEEIDAQRAALEAEKQKLVDAENERIRLIEEEKQKKLDIEEDKRRAVEQLERNKLAEEERKKLVELRIEEAVLQAQLAEEKRVSDLAEADRLKQEKRDENKRIVTRVQNRAIEAMVETTDVSEKDARAIAHAISDLMIPNLKFTY